MMSMEHDSVVSKSLQLYGEWAQDELNTLSAYIRRGATVLDVGAFIGTHTLAFSHMVGEGGKVISFEPRIEAFTLLQKTIDINKLRNVELHRCGLGHKEGELQLAVAGADEAVNFAGLSLEQDSGDAVGGSRYTTSIRRLDSMGVSSVDLIKIDVEGMERDVLDGAIETIAASRPLIFAECNSLAAGVPLLDWSKAFDYQCMAILSSAYNENNFSRNSENVFGRSKELNLILCPNEKIESCWRGDGYLVDDPDDLNLILLHKPQYPLEVLIKANRGEGPGINYPSLLAQTLAVEKDLIASRLSEIQHSLNEHREDANRLRAVTAQLMQTAASLREDLSSVQRSRHEREEYESRITAAQKALGVAVDAARIACAETSELRASRSWRITRPFRLIGSIVRKLRQ